MMDYIWKCSAFGPTVGVTKEGRGKKAIYKAWWNGCGLHQGTTDLHTAKLIALKYMFDHASMKRDQAAQTIVEVAAALKKIELEMRS